MRGRLRGAYARHAQQFPTSAAREAEMVAEHKKGRELARAMMDCPELAPEAMRAGYEGEQRRMRRELNSGPAGG